MKNPLNDRGYFTGISSENVYWIVLFELLMIRLLYKMKDYYIQLAKPQPEQIGQKDPLLFCLLVRYMACIMWHNVTLLNHILCIIEHHIDELAEKPLPLRQPNREKFFRLDLSISCNFQQLWVQLAEKPPTPWEKRRPGERPGSCHTWRIPMVPILQIHTQIPPIQISSIGYQLCQLFKILTYTELQDTRSWCRWKAYR